VFPPIFPPPISRSPPRSRRRHHFAAHAVERNPRQPSIAHLDACRQRRSENAKPHSCPMSVRKRFTIVTRRIPQFSACLVFRTARFGSRFGRNSRRNKPSHLKRIRPMRIRQLRRAHVHIAPQIAQPRNRKLEFFRVGRTRKKQSTLRESRLRRFGRHKYFQHSRRRRLRLQSQPKQFQQHL